MKKQKSKEVEVKALDLRGRDNRGRFKKSFLPKRKQTWMHAFYLTIINMLLWVITTQIFIGPFVDEYLDKFSIIHETQAQQIVEVKKNETVKHVNTDKVEVVVTRQGDISMPIGMKAAATRACEARGFTDKTCRNDLLGIKYAESRRQTDCANLQGSNDSGMSHGCFQINIGKWWKGADGVWYLKKGAQYHLAKHIHPDPAQRDTSFDPYDFEQAAEWTLNKLMSKNYPEYRTVAIQCHNGCGVPNGYAASVKDFSNRIID